MKNAEKRHLSSIHGNQHKQSDTSVKLDMDAQNRCTQVELNFLHNSTDAVLQLFTLSNISWWLCLSIENYFILNSHTAVIWYKCIIFKNISLLIKLTILLFFQYFEAEKLTIFTCYNDIILKTVQLAFNPHLAYFFTIPRSDTTESESTGSSTVMLTTWSLQRLLVYMSTCMFLTTWTTWANAW